MAIMIPAFCMRNGSKFHEKSRTNKRNKPENLKTEKRKKLWKEENKVRTKRRPMETLSNDTRFLLALHLELPDIFHLAVTCQAFYKIIKNDLLFRALFYRDYGPHLRVYTIAHLREWYAPFSDIHTGQPIDDRVVKMVDNTIPQKVQLERFKNILCPPAGWTWRAFYEKFYRTRESILWIMREQAGLHRPISTTSSSKTWHLPPKGWTKKMQINVVFDVGEPQRDIGTRMLSFQPIYYDPSKKSNGCADFDDYVDGLNSTYTPLQVINQELRMAQGKHGGKKGKKFTKRNVKRLLSADIICVAEGAACKTVAASGVAQFELMYPIHALRHFLNGLKRQVRAEYQEQHKMAHTQPLVVEHCFALPRGLPFTGDLTVQLDDHLVSYFRSACDLKATLLFFEQASKKARYMHECIGKPHWMLDPEQCSFSYTEANYEMGTLTRTFCTSTTGVTARQQLCTHHASEQIVPQNCSVPPRERWAKIHKQDVFKERLMGPLVLLKTELTCMLKDCNGYEIPINLNRTRAVHTNDWMILLREDTF
jgi:hypothetical protein